MRIDAHQHFWTYVPSEYQWIRHPALMRNFTPDDLMPLMAECGYSGTVAVQARSTLAETQWLLDLAKKYPFIKGVVGSVDLCDSDLRLHLMRFSLNPLFRGVRTGLKVNADDSQKLAEDFMFGMGVLGEFAVTFDILIRPEQLDLASTLVETFPDQVFILDHIANPSIKDHLFEPWNTKIRQLATHANVYCKVSGMVTRADHQHWQKRDFMPYLSVVFEAFGVDRLMIGSDWPVCTQAATYTQTMDIVQSFVAELRVTQRDAVLGQTAISAYGLRV